LYICPQGSPAFERHLRVRDYLRKHPEEAREYAEVKQRLAREYGIGYVRTVKDRGGDRRRIAISVLNRLGNGDRNTIGVAEAGHLSVDRLIALFEHVSGTTELVTHPGLGVTGYGHWKYDWETETRSLCDPRVREALARNGIELIAPSHV